MKNYKAIIWKRDSDRSGVRVTILAENPTEAAEKLKQEYGEDCIYTLSNEDEASAIR